MLSQEFLILRNLNKDLIVGFNFIKRYQVDISLTRNAIIVKNERINFKRSSTLNCAHMFNITIEKDETETLWENQIKNINEFR